MHITRDLFSSGPSARARHKGRQLVARAFEKEGHVRQAAIVENKLLGAALQYAKQLQEQRDDHKLQSPSVAKREKRLVRARQAQASLST